MANLLRRSFIVLLGLSLPFGLKSQAQTKDSQKTNNVLSPHAEAISLVQTKQPEEIIKAEREYFTKHATEDYQGNIDRPWWFDTIERTWVVRRPFGPGIFDSTHWFTVSYKIKDEIVASWSVDTDKNKVEKTKIS
jgi:hypothetical protein